MQPIRLFVATPAYGGMCQISWAMSCMQLVNACMQANIEVLFSMVANESLITRARNQLASEFLKSDATHMLFIDADHSFNAGHILRMIQADKDIIGAVCAKKSIDWDQVRLAVKHEAENLEEYTGRFASQFLDFDDYLDINKPLEAKNIGTGIMLIKRNVFETLKPRVDSYISNNNSDPTTDGERIYEFFATIIIDEQLYSEDYFFCHKWREAGGKVYLAPWVENTHWGTYEFKGSLLAKAILDTLESNDESK